MPKRVAPAKDVLRLPNLAVCGCEGFRLEFSISDRAISALREAGLPVGQSHVGRLKPVICHTYSRRGLAHHLHLFAVASPSEKTAVIGVDKQHEERADSAVKATEVQRRFQLVLADAPEQLPITLRMELNMNLALLAPALPPVAPPSAGKYTPVYLSGFRLRGAETVRDMIVEAVNETTLNVRTVLKLTWPRKKETLEQLIQRAQAVVREFVRNPSSAGKKDG